MTDRPILFSAPMVRALLAGTKMQTRRIYKPKAGFPKQDGEQHPDGSGECWTEWGPCPYGQPGDRLRVKESAWMWCEKRPNGTTKTGRPKFHYVPLQSAPVLYASDHPKRPGIDVVSPETGNAWGWRMKVARFLPRWASRITLEITGVRVERLQDISEADAKAEGVSMEQWDDEFHDIYHTTDHRAAYRLLWNQINGAGSWDLNPWVWVVEFKRVTP